MQQPRLAHLDHVHTVRRDRGFVEHAHVAAWLARRGLPAREEGILAGVQVSLFGQ